eukprot:scaffold220719_cov17-Tisochrysis_lutea.AAC.1
MLLTSGDQQKTAGPRLWSSLWPLSDDGVTGQDPRIVRTCTSNQKAAPLAWTSAPVHHLESTRPLFAIKACVHATVRPNPSQPL